MHRLHLRPLALDDEGAVGPWLAEAVAAVQGRGAQQDAGLSVRSLMERWDRAYPDGRTLAGVLHEGEIVGLLRARAPEATGVVMDALTVRAELRNLGYGQEMVFALEESGGAGGVAFAGVPRANGLAIYFWLRTGYRPLYPLPEPLPDGLDRERFWMTRALSER